ncbi:hypothetical protein D915_008656 [Fasciola hepatica]|uniref:Uncharacterized protein n=1 Tax=Fasciola hepatica TaxID=6192 RepID=A0A4E0QZC2_FASHE|nr:hypothetical protein D915_008656 [Fasciola hepatica]
MDAIENVIRSSFDIPQNRSTQGTSPNETSEVLVEPDIKRANIPLAIDQPVVVTGKTGVRLIWKAFIQTPVRLTEADTWPIAKPEQCGTIAAEKPSLYTMNKTIRDYRHILPNMNELAERRRHRESSHASRMTSTRLLFNSSRGRKMPRFLKTLPSRQPRFPPLKRSSQFEDFLKVLDTNTSVDSGSFATEDIVKTSTTPEAVSEKWEESDKPSQSGESNVGTEEPQKVSETHPRKKVASLSSCGSKVSHRKKGLRKRKSNSAKNRLRSESYHSTSHRHLTALQLLREQRAQSAITDMTVSGSSHLNPKAFSEDDSVVESLRSSQVKPFRIQSHFSRGTQFDLLTPKVVDMEDRLTGLEILDAKIRDYDMQLPIKSDNEERLRKLYQITIMKEPMLKSLLNSFRLDTLPPDLRHLVRIGSLYRQVPGFERPPEENEVGTDPFDVKLHVNDEIAVNDPENLWIEAGVLTVGLFTHWMKKVQPNQLFRYLTVNEVEVVLRNFGKQLSDTFQVATSTAREELHSAIAACAENLGLMPVLLRTAEDWLDNLLGCLCSADRTVREETCYVLAFTFTNRTVVDFIRNYPTVDIAYDVTTAVLHAIELHQASFLHYYCLLALMIEGCPMFSILKAVMEIGPHSTSTLLNYIWPRLIYYALKYWNGKQFLRDRVLLKNLNECIEKAYLRGISRRNAKLAQIQLSRRFKILTKPTTVWLDEWKKFDV